MAAKVGGDTASEQQAESSPPVLMPFEEALKFIDFKMERMGPACVEGRLVVSEKSCQPFGVLHGGVSALLAESLASLGAFLAAGRRRVAGAQLTINHLKAAPIGTEVLVTAKPIHVGQRTQVWDVILSKVGKLAAESSKSITFALARVTLIVDPSKTVLDVDWQGMPFARL